MVTVAEQKMTWDEYRTLEFDDSDLFIYELINGELVKRTAPSLKHQEVVSTLMIQMGMHIKQNNLGKLFTAPVDVFFDGANGVQPDLAFIKKERFFIIENGEYIHGAPDLIIEIISPGSVKRDKVVKKDLFAFP